jgi:8-oxo-dGTP pyrophosphatase MutT (NUDIX family)
LCPPTLCRLDYDPKARERVPKPEPRGPLTSAGFLIKSADLYLVCHATNRKPSAATDGSWTISKGIVDAGETPIEAAMRELKEETGIDLKGEEQLTSLIPAPDAQPINSYTVGKGAAKKTVRLPSSRRRHSDHRGPTHTRLCSSLTATTTTTGAGV